MPLFRNQTFASTTGTSHTGVEPTNTATHDVVLGLYATAAAGNPALPAGWTSLFSVSQGAFKAVVGYVIRGATAPSYAFTHTGSVYYEHYLIAIKPTLVGWAVRLDSVSASGTLANGTTHSPDPPATVALAGASLAVAGAINWAGSSGSWAAPSGYTVRSDNTVGNDCVIIDKSLTVAGSENPGAIGTPVSGANDYWDGFTATFADIPLPVAPSFQPTGQRNVGPAPLRVPWLQRALTFFQDAPVTDTNPQPPLRIPNRWVGPPVLRYLFRQPQTFSPPPVASSGSVTNASMDGTVASSGVLAFVVSKLLAGTVASSGALVKVVSQLLAGTVASSGALVKVANKVFAGTVTSAGALAKVANKALSGSVASAGTIAFVANKLAGGTITSAGGVVWLASKVFAGTVTSAGTLTKVVNKSFAGTIASSGTLALSQVTVRAFAGTVASVGALVKVVNKALSGTVAPAGTLAKFISKPFAGSVASSGALAKTVGRALSGSVASAGTLDTTVIPASAPSPATVTPGPGGRRTGERVRLDWIPNIGRILPFPVRGAGAVTAAAPAIDGEGTVTPSEVSGEGAVVVGAGYVSGDGHLCRELAGQVSAPVAVVGGRGLGHEPWTEDLIDEHDLVALGVL